MAGTSDQVDARRFAAGPCRFAGQQRQEQRLSRSSRTRQHAAATMIFDQEQKPRQGLFMHRTLVEPALVERISKGNFTSAARHKLQARQKNNSHVHESPY
jgi:hypothetical protein